MNNKLPLATVARFLELRGALDGIQQISFSFYNLNKHTPIEKTLEGSSEEDVQVLIDTYEKLVAQAKERISKV